MTLTDCLRSGRPQIRATRWVEDRFRSIVTLLIGPHRGGGWQERSRPPPTGERILGWEILGIDNVWSHKHPQFVLPSLSRTYSGLSSLLLTSADQSVPNNVSALRGILCSKGSVPDTLSRRIGGCLPYHPCARRDSTPSTLLLQSPAAG